MVGGMLYAVSGEDGWVYYGQITSERLVGFFRFRSKGVVEVDEVLASPVMAVILVGVPSITSALRGGSWKKLGRFEIVSALVEPRPWVQWPVGTLTVTVWSGESHWETQVDDPAIQSMEILAGWDAQFHIPSRLTADFGEEDAPWHVGGPIRRERLIKQELAARFPDEPWHRLPDNWPPVSAR